MDDSGRNMQGQQRLTPANLVPVYQVYAAPWVAEAPPGVLQQPAVFHQASLSAAAPGAPVDE